MPTPTDRRPPTDRRWLDVAVAAALLAVLTWQAWAFLGLSIPQQIREIPDDSFFYLQVARSFCDGNGFTFDGETPTYGFQPLWQLVLIAFCSLIGGGRALFVAAFLTCAALHTGVAWALFRLGRNCFSTGAGLAAALLWIANPALFTWSAGLKENALYALLLVIALARFARDLRHPGGTMRDRRRRAIGFGVLLGLMVFTRVNALIPAAALLGAHLVAIGLGGGLRARLHHVAIATIAAGIVALPWYAFAWWHFGTAMPTSGTWKLLLMRAQVEHGWGTPWLSFGHVLAALRLWPDYLVMLFHSGFSALRAPLYAAAIAWPILALARRLSPRRIPLWPRGSAAAVWLLLVLTGSAAIASFANQLMLPGYLAYARWYAVPEYLLIAIVGGGLLGTCWRKGDSWIHLAGSLALLGAATWLWPPTLRSPRDDPREAFTEL
ncbi:MAG TPA: hypothetical protein ENI87_05920, partial [bacterium]|nr:hypothetical protein [bacterium]